MREQTFVLGCLPSLLWGLLIIVVADIMVRIGIDLANAILHGFGL